MGDTPLKRSDVLSPTEIKELASSPRTSRILAKLQSIYPDGQIRRDVYNAMMEVFVENAAPVNRYVNALRTLRRAQFADEQPPNTQHTPAFVRRALEEYAKTMPLGLEELMPLLRDLLRIAEDLRQEKNYFPPRKMER